MVKENYKILIKEFKHKLMTYHIFGEFSQNWYRFVRGRIMAPKDATSQPPETLNVIHLLEMKNQLEDIRIVNQLILRRAPPRLSR